MCKKKIQVFLLFAIEMVVLSDFLQKKGLGPLGVKETAVRKKFKTFNFI